MLVFDHVFLVARIIRGGKEGVTLKITVSAT